MSYKRLLLYVMLLFFLSVLCYIWYHDADKEAYCLYPHTNVSYQIIYKKDTLIIHSSGHENDPLIWINNGYYGQEIGDLTLSTEMDTAFLIYYDGIHYVRKIRKENDSIYTSESSIIRNEQDTASLVLFRYNENYKILEIERTLEITYR